MAEALFWPILPDFLVFAVIPAAPTRWFKLAVAAAIGSVFGGVMGYWLAFLRDSSAPLEYLPLITEGMIHQAGAWFASDGAIAVLRQPLSGIPYKVFVYLGGSGKVSFPVYLWASATARGVRLLAVAGIAGLFGHVTRRFLPRWYAAFLIVFCLVFAYGLSRVVSAFPAP